MSDDETRVIDLPAIHEETQAHMVAAESVLCAIEAGARTYVSRNTADFTRRKTLEPARFVVQELRMMASGTWRPRALDLRELDTAQGISSLRLVAADGRRGERQNVLYSELLVYAEAILEAARRVNAYLASLE